MELDTIFKDTKWGILVALSKGPASPLELAKKTHTTISNISIQLRLLEALGFVKSEKKPSGRSRVEYSLSKEFAYITIVKDNYCAKRLLRIEPFDSIMLSAMFSQDNALRYASAWLCAMEVDLLEKAAALGYVGKTAQGMEFLALSDRSESKSFNMMTLEGEVTISLNYRTIEEVENSGEITKCYPLYDPGGILVGLKQKKIIRQDTSRQEEKW